jgi:hypothetical protein
MKLNAGSTIARQPPSMTSKCPRPVISMVSVTPGFFVWIL